MQTTIHDGLVDHAANTVARFARRVADHRASTHPEAWTMDDLQTIGRISSTMETMQRHYIEVARHQGASWSTIGIALGMTAQGAQQWYSRRA